MACLCLLVAPSLAGAKDDSDDEEAAVPTIKDGQAQIVKRFEDPDMWIRHDLWVQTEFDSDGDGKLDRMHVGVTRQRQTDTEGLRVPVIYGTSPYYAGTSSPVHTYMWDTRQELGEEPPKREAASEIKRKGERPIISKAFVKDWVPRGFAVVHSSSPGTGLSQGCPTVGGENESLAPKAVIDWLNGRAKGYTTPEGADEVRAYWSTGKVGMTGTSYNGTLTLAAATTGVEGLEAIIPVAPNTSYYHYYRSHGLVRSPGGFVGEDIDVLYDFIHSGNEQRREYCDCEIRDQEMLDNLDRVTGDYNRFWAGRDYLNHIDGVRAAVLMAHGFNDWNVMPEHSFRIYQALKERGVPARIYYHQGGHGGPPPLKMMNRWFTRYLHDVDNGIDTEDRAWIVREDDERSKPTAYQDYPNPEAQPVGLFLAKGAPEQGELSTTKLPKQGRETLVDNFSFSGTALAQAEWTRHRLIYVTPELKRPLHVSGTACVTTKLASNKPAANLSVWLVSLPWNNARKAKVSDNI
ncbi:MAG: Xaa-Pro dipeptidyl-peptidase, partial [bacterium]|nr:Xaa-Pro dipeptidyl-peptidase [bacterium]